MSSPRVGIVGAGITGLAAHHELQKRGIESNVWEAAESPGGVIESERTDGRLLEFGPQRTRLTAGIEDLLAELAITDQVIEAPALPLYVYHDDSLRLVPRTVRDALRTDLLSWRGKVRALAEPLAGPPKAGETVESYLTRAFGVQVARRLGGPLYAGLYASDPGDMPVEHSIAPALDRLGVDRSVLAAVLRSRLRGRSPPPVVSFEEGMQTLPTAIYQRYRETIDLGTPVTSVQSARDKIEVETASRSHEVDHVVMTTPAAATGQLLESVDPDSARALRSLTYNSVVVVHLSASVSRAGSGYQVSMDEDLRTRGVTWNEPLLGRDGIVTCFLGGATHPELQEWSEERLGQTAVSEFEMVTGCSADVLSVRRRQAVMPAYDSSWDALERVSLPGEIHLCANYESRAGIPGRIGNATRLAEALANESVDTGTISQ